MAESALGILQREGEQRGAAGHFPDASDFDDHVRFYQSTVRFVRIAIAAIAVLLVGMYLFLVK
jgi:hypothetical protein